MDDEGDETNTMVNRGHYDQTIDLENINSGEDNDKVSKISAKGVITSNDATKDDESGEERDEEGERKVHFSGATSAKKRSSKNSHCGNYKMVP